MKILVLFIKLSALCLEYFKYSFALLSLRGVFLQKSCYFENAVFFVQGIGIFVGFVGFLAMFGWLFDVEFLRQWLAGTISMKFTTAVSFFVTGFLLFFLIKLRHVESVEYAQLVVFNASLALFLLMGTLLLSIVFGVETGIELLIAEEKAPAVATLFLGLPSLMTMIAFDLIALAGFLSVFEIDGRIIFGLGVVVFLIGLVAVVGYATGVHGLYYDFPEVTNPIAVSTAFLFVLAGLALCVFGCCRSRLRD